MTEIKICGINEPRAMDAALDAGADFVGLVIFPASPRAVSLAAATELAQRARGRARTVALVVDAADELLAKIVSAVAPDFFQLHGKESPGRVAAIKHRFHRPVIRAIPIAAAGDLAQVSAFAAVADWLLFDTTPPKDATRPGGHGRTFDWRLLAGAERPKPIMLSGGLNAENVAQAIGIVRPDAVDVSSGVESAPGVKDPEQIKAFVAAARAVPGALRPTRERVS